MFSQSYSRRLHDGVSVSAGVRAADGGRLRPAQVWASFFMAFLLMFGFSLDARSEDGVNQDNSWHWKVERVSGRVQVETKTGESFVAERGMVVRRGWKVKTGGGRIVVARGKEKFTISPRSVVTLEPKGFLIRRTVLYQDQGQVEVDVKRRWYRHFEVETPFLAAVVKGTAFKVSVSRNSASINVGRGVVNVHDFASGEIANVGAGQSAASNPSRHVGLSVGGKTKPSVQDGPKRAPAFDTRIAKNVPATAEEARAANAQSRGVTGTNGAGTASRGANNSANAAASSNSASSSNTGGSNVSSSSSSGKSSSGGKSTGNGNSGNSGKSSGNSGKSSSGNKGNSGGKGNSGNNGNSGGNGKGNSGGSGNGNGNSGNGNSGGNGKGNSGGNGKGRK